MRKFALEEEEKDKAIFSSYACGQFFGGIWVAGPLCGPLR
jgi:hypothetical protein